MDDDGNMGCVLALFFIAIIGFTVSNTVLDLADDEEMAQQQAQETTEEPEPATEPEDPNLIEGVVVRLIPGPNDITTVVFEDNQYDLKLGDHQLYVGEWNQLRVDNGVVHETYLGEGTVQEMARKQ